MANCYNGFAFNITFDMSSLNLTLPNDIIVGVAYNTQTYGARPLAWPGRTTRSTLVHWGLRPSALTTTRTMCSGIP